MKIKVQIGNIDYDTIIRNALPLLKEKNDSKIIGIISGVVNMPGDLAMKMISAIPQETKNEFVAYIINLKKETIANIITDSLVNKGFPIEVCDIKIVNIILVCKFQKMLAIL